MRNNLKSSKDKVIDTGGTTSKLKKLNWYTMESKKTVQLIIKIKLRQLD